MTDYLSSEKKYVRDLNKQGKKEHRLYTVLACVFYLIAAFLFWQLMFNLCNIIGAIVSGTPQQGIVQLKRMLPIFINTVIFVYLGLSLQNTYMAVSTAKRVSRWKINGIVTIILGCITIAYVVYGVVTGEYYGFVEGYPSLLFPLDQAIAGLAVCLYGVFCIKYSKKLKIRGSELPCFGKKINPVLSAFRGIGFTLSYLVSIFSLAACCYSVYVRDWTHGGALFNIMLFVTFFISFLMVVIYRFLYCELKTKYRNGFMLMAGVLFLILNTYLMTVYFVSVELFNEAPNVNAFGVLPVEFTASVNAFFPIYSLNNILAPLIATIKALVIEKRNKKTIAGDEDNEQQGVE